MIERYQTEEMRRLWSDEARFAVWTRVELAAAEAWHKRGEISAADMQHLRNHASPPQPSRVSELEKTTQHDVVAFVRALSERVGEPSSRHLHRGLTSSDVVDTALALTLKQSIAVVVQATVVLQQVVARRALEHKQTVCAGRTHGVHAEPTTFGLRLLGWHTELGRHLGRLRRTQEQISVGKLSGAVGNFSQSDPEFEAFVMNQLDLTPEAVATQVIPRDRHAEVLTTLGLLTGGLERFATEIRSLQRTDLREAEEPFATGQTGSSAMPHKRNPITCERICGIARLLRGYVVAELESCALWHERDISHSSVERVVFPDAFHLTHYALRELTRIIEGLRVYPEQMKRNMEKTRGLLFSQSVLGVLLAEGMDRQEAYRVVQSAAMRVWEDESLTLQKTIADHPWVAQHLSEDKLAKAFALEPYVRHVDALFKRAGLTA